MTDQFVMWNGERWGLYSDGYFRRGARYLHREKWTKLRGEIPLGHHIHHKNHIRHDNRISNLECLSRSEHMSHHSKGRRFSDASYKAGADKRRLSRKEIGAKISAAHCLRERVKRVCEWCGVSMLAFNPYKKLCSLACHQNKRYHSGVDNEQRSCGWCKKDFTVNRYKSTLTCSRSCGHRLRYAKAKGVSLG